MDIGVRELKERLSEVLERAAQGEVIRVTDRGKPKAMLGPVPGRGRLELGLEQGWIRAAEALPVARVERVTADRRVNDVLEDDRGL